MSQYDFGNLESPLTGTDLINTHLEPWRNAVHSNHSGSSRPSYAAAAMTWINNGSNPWVLNVFDGTDDIPMGSINITTNVFTLTGHAQAPSSSGFSIYNSSGTLIATYGASTSTTVTFAGQVTITGLTNVTGKLATPDKGELTIASGAITITGVSHTVDTESDAATDDLDTISGGADGEIITLRIANSARAVVITNAGNIVTPRGGNINLQSTSMLIALQYDAELTKWVVLSAPPINYGLDQNIKSAAYTTVLADANGHILHPSADTTARIFTIDSNANVPYKIGTTLTFVNQNGAGTVTIAITSDTMRLAGAGTTGSRTLAANGIATALKITSTEWIISGTGLT